MKKILIYIGILIGIVVLPGACDKKGLLEYQNDPRIYFSADSVTYSFFLEKSTRVRDTISVSIHAMGIPAGSDRSFRMVQTNAGEENAAQPGVHYVGFDNEEMLPHLMIKAGKASVSVPLIVLRDSSMSKQEYRLEIELLPNENFKLGIDTKLRMAFKLSDIAVKPKYWDSNWKKVFGVWGSVKMRFVIDNIGITEFDGKMMEVSEIDYYRTKINRCLEEYNANHDKDLQEADGTKIVFPKK